MLNNILSFIVKGFFWLLNIISQVIIAPLMFLIRFLFPDLANYLVATENFFYDYVLNGVAFVKEVILNVTGFPRPLFNLLITIWLGYIAYNIAKRPIKFILNRLRQHGVIHLGPGMEE